VEECKSRRAEARERALAVGAPPLFHSSTPRRPYSHTLAVLLGAFLVLGARLAPAAETRVQLAELPPEAEAAIQRGLGFLAGSQNADGSWGEEHKPAITALALMAFMVKGQFPERGEAGPKLDKAVAYLLHQGETASGYFGTSRQGMYEHGLATLALSEVWGMTERDGVRDALKRAVLIILGSQNGEGGWRYQPQPTEADISVTVMQIVALASAQEAGILVPAETIRKAIAYVKSCQDKSSGGFGYQRGGGGVKFSSTAAGLMSLLMAGERKGDPIDRSLAYLLQQPDSKFDNTQFYFYAHYYAIQAMYQLGEERYQAWSPKIQNALLAKQGKDGSWRGGEESHPAYGTSMAILILGVPYRFLPIYQR
jgi:hypothetical protein